MACELMQGNEILCRDGVGGIKELYLANFENIASTTISSGVCTGITMVGTTKFYTFQLEKENGQYDNNAIPSVENGTTFWDSTITFTMKKLSASMKNQLNNLAQARLMAIVLDNNGVYWVAGVTLGVDASEMTTTSGKAFGDMGGATLTFVGKEPVNDPTFTGTIGDITD